MHVFLHLAGMCVCVFLHLAAAVWCCAQVKITDPHQTWTT